MWFLFLPKSFSIETKMKIYWTPWFNVPTERRLQLFSMTLLMFLTLVSPLVCSIFILYILVGFHRPTFCHPCSAFTRRYLSFQIWFQYAANMYLKTLCVLYLAFAYYDRNAGDRGGRGAGWAFKFILETPLYATWKRVNTIFFKCNFRVAWLRGLKIWKYCVDYFPLDLVKTVDLPADRNYLVCFFPHGIIR